MAYINGKEILFAPIGAGGESESSTVPQEIATEEEMTALLESAPVGAVYKYTGTTGTYENGALYVVTEE